MAAGDQPATLAEMRTDFLESLKEVTGNATVNTIVDRYLNRGNHRVHQERPGWPWQERRARLITHPGYSTGTVAIAAATRTTVTGTTTLWNTAVTGMGFNNTRVGGKLTFAGGTTPYLVSAVGSDTAITLADRYVGDALATAPYEYYEDEYALEADFESPVDVHFFDDDRKIALLGAREFYHRFIRNTRRGKPTHATIIELGPSGAVALRPRVLFGPAPDDDYSVPYRYYTRNLAVSSLGVAAANLAATTDEPIVPLRFRRAIVEYALEFWTRERKQNPLGAEAHRLEAKRILAIARSAYGPADDRPRLKPAVAAYWDAAARPWGRRGARRYSTDTRFDTLQD